MSTYFFAIKIIQIWHNADLKKRFSEVALANNNNFVNVVEVLVER